MQKFYAKTDVGMQREKNEDYFKVGTYGGYNIYVLADGMGGYQGGEIASKMASEEIVDVIERAVDLKLIEENNGIGLTIIDSVKKANNKIFEYAKKDKSLKNMGTTIIVVIEKENNIYYTNVGDSRLYRIRGGSLEQISVDDTFVGELLKDGIITEEEAKTHPQRHVLTKALGIGKKIDLKYSKEVLEKEDIFLLCSDGITNMLSKEEITKIILDGKRENIDAAKALVDAANTNGGTDNSTAIVIYM